MTFKMHLCARVPNEGARRLAWWLGEGGVPALGRLGSTGDCDIERVERLLAGELVPGAEMAMRISQATGGAVLTTDWRDPPRGAWGERPVMRTMFSPSRRCVIDDPDRGGSFAGAWARALRQTGRDPQAVAA